MSISSREKSAKAVLGNKLTSISGCWRWKSPSRGITQYEARPGCTLTVST
jgi:hypothetical protein